MNLAIARPRIPRARVGRWLLPGLLALVLGLAQWLSPSAQALSLVTTIAVGSGPDGVGVDPTTHRVYVANSSDNTMSVIDGTSNTVLATLGVGTDPSGVAVDPTTHYVYVANEGDNAVSVIDGTTNAVVATVGVGGYPFGVGVDPTTDRVYVANSSDNTMSVIDGTSNTVVATLGVGTDPSGVAVDPTTQRVYVANQGGETVSVIDAAHNTVVNTVKVGNGPFAVGVDSTTDRVYVANRGDGTVSVIDGTSNAVVGTIGDGGQPYAVGVDPTTSRVYVANKDQNTVSVIDDSPVPTANPTQSPAANKAGWNNSDVTVTWNWADNYGGSGIDSNNCTTGSTSSGEGTITLSATCQDLAGNQGKASYTVKVDKTSPTITASAKTADGTTYDAGSWTNQAVTVHFTCNDTLSGVASCPADQTFSTEGVTQAASGTATDNAGNTASASFGPIQIDTTAPTISAAATSQPNANGWYNANVTIHFTCADNLSGVASCPSDQVLSTEGSTVSSTAQTATDNAGNVSAPSNVVTVKIDKTAPVVTVTGVSNDASYTLGNVPTPGCTTTDALSGVATPATLQVSGDAADGVGSFTATCEGAQDKAGNLTSPVSATYTVGYNFSGFLAPVASPPTVNTGKAGRAYPVKWQLTDASGAYMSSLSAVKSITYQTTSCSAFASAPTAALPTDTAGNSGLRYDSTANQYVYTWATPGTGGCYTLFLTLDSGQVFSADFNLR